MELGPNYHFLIIIIIIFQFQSLPACSACIGKSVGENGAEAVAGGLRDSSKNLATAADKAASELANSVKSSTNDLSDSIDKLASDAAVAVQRMSDGMLNLAKRVDVTVNTADLKDFGVEAAQHLGFAMKKINIQGNFTFAINDNVVAAVKYISIAVWIIFSLCFIAVLVSLKSWRKCTAKLCVEGCPRLRDLGSASSDQGGKDYIIIVPQEQHKFLKNLETENDIILGNKTSDYNSATAFNNNVWKQIEEKYTVNKTLNEMD